MIEMQGNGEGKAETETIKGGDFVLINRAKQGRCYITKCDKSIVHTSMSFRQLSAGTSGCSLSGHKWRPNYGRAKRFNAKARRGEGAEGGVDAAGDFGG